MRLGDLMQVGLQQTETSSCWRSYNSLLLNTLFILWLCLATNMASAQCVTRNTNTKGHEFRTDYLESLANSCSRGERRAKLDAWARQQDGVLESKITISAKEALEIPRAYADDLGDNCRAVERVLKLGGRRRFTVSLTSNQANETARWLKLCVQMIDGRAERLDLIRQAALAYKLRTNMFGDLACRRTGSCGPIDKGYESPARALVDMVQEQVEPPTLETRKLTAAIEIDSALRETWSEIYELFKRSNPDYVFRFSSRCRSRLSKMEEAEFEWSWARLVSGAPEKTICI